MRFALAAKATFAATATFAAALAVLPAAVAPARAADIMLEPAPARAPRPVAQTADERGGELRCIVAGGVGFVVVGKRATSCVYYRRDGRVEFYTGSFGRFGIDIGPASARSAIFAVNAPVPEPIGVLDGDFHGLGVGTSIGRGESGDALVGGRFGTASIIPIANSRMTGLNLAVAISELHLRYKGTEGRQERYRNNLPEGLD